MTEQNEVEELANLIMCNMQGQVAFKKVAEEIVKAGYRISTKEQPKEFSGYMTERPEVLFKEMVWPEKRPLNALRNLQAEGWNACHAAFMKIITMNKNTNNEDACKKAYEEAKESPGVGLDREKVATVLWEAKKGDKVLASEQVMLMEECYREADFICAKFPTRVVGVPTVEEIEAVIGAKNHTGTISKRELAIAICELIGGKV